MAVEMNIVVIRGDDFEWEITIQNPDGSALDLTDFLATGKARKKYSDALPSFEFNCAIWPDQIEFPGRLDVSLDDTVTASLKLGSHVYDIEVTNPTGKVKKIYRGTVSVLDEATR